MKEGRGEGGEKPPSSDFRQKMLQPRDELTLKRAKGHEQTPPLFAIPGAPMAPKSQPNRAG